MQHWWLPPTGAGVRTRFTRRRGLAALRRRPATSEVTGDVAVLDEQVPFLEGDRSTPDEHEVFFTPSVSETSAPLYDHCVRALERGLARRRATACR